MKEVDLKFKVKAALTFAYHGGLRESLFEDSVQEDAEMVMETIPGIPRSQKNVVEQAIQEWRDDHRWLAHMPDKFTGVGD